MVVLDGDEEWYFSTDSVPVEFTDTDGVVEENGGTEFYWDAVPTVDASDIPSPYHEFFDTEVDEFFKFSATVARPIPQKYVISGDEYTFKKPAEHLKKAAWSLDNKPWTLGHPSTKAVKSVDQIHGFWKNPRWVGDSQDLDATLYFPADDERAREYVRDTDEVSVGFTHRLAQTDEDGIDAYQTNLYFDHVASVQKGRCSNENGCGLNVDHAHVFDTDSPRMTPTVADVGEEGTASDKEYHEISNNTNMSETDCGCDDGGDSVLDISEMSTDAVRRRHDGLDETLTDYEETVDEYEAAYEAVDEARETLDLDEDDSLVDAIESLRDERDEAQSALEETRESEKEDMRETLVENTSMDEDDVSEMDYDELSEKVDFLDHIEVEETDDGGSETTATTADATSPSEEEEADTSDETEVQYDIQY